MAIASERVHDRVWFCCNRRAPRSSCRGEAESPSLVPHLQTTPKEADGNEANEASETVENPDSAKAEWQTSPLNRAERPDAVESGSSGYFSNSNSSSGSDVSDPCFWKPRRVHSESSAASATSSDQWQAEAQKEELERLTAQVPVTATGKPTSLGSVQHPHGCCPCMFFAKPSGCIRGVQCEFCHFPHQINVKKNLSMQRSAGSGRPGEACRSRAS
mmetsp:Transcript_12616/g.23733  ORF Transcript_12616/g.23733 Transcript_12616/m.23733 type:complete len:216 (+) Transcript_12616:62-709(+)